MSDPVNFSVMSRSELVTRLEKMQAVLSMAADAMGEKIAAEELMIEPVGSAFDRGYFHGLCHSLDVLQERKTNSNRDDRAVKSPHMKEKPCEEPTFV